MDDSFYEDKEPLPADYSLVTQEPPLLLLWPPIMPAVSETIGHAAMGAAMPVATGAEPYVPAALNTVDKAPAQAPTEGATFARRHEDGAQATATLEPATAGRSVPRAEAAHSSFGLIPQQHPSGHWPTMEYDIEEELIGSAPFPFSLSSSTLSDMGHIHFAPSAAARCPTYMDTWDLEANHPSVHTHMTILQAAAATPHQLALRSFADTLVARHSSAMQQVLPSATTPPTQWQQQDGTITAINSTPLPYDAIIRGTTAGVTVMELFGGMAAGLEMLLRNGVRVAQYYYCDHNAAARSVALHRLEALTRAYPDHLPTEAWLDAFTTFPQDVWAITFEQCRHYAADCCQWVIIGGFECQDLSPAGAGAGLKGSRSITFYPLLNILGWLQQLQPARPPLYVIENTYMQGDKATTEVQKAFNTICNSIGRPVLLDAAQTGSHAHRLRNYWTNLAQPETLQILLDAIPRDPSIMLTDIMDPGHRPQRCTIPHRPPYFSVNRPGAALTVLPTLMSTYHSYSFRDGRAGMVLNDQNHCVDLSIEEREQALGYDRGATDAPNVSAAARQRITGQCFDINAMQCLWAVGTALSSSSFQTEQQEGVRPRQQHVLLTPAVASHSAADPYDCLPVPPPARNLGTCLSGRGRGTGRNTRSMGRH